MKSKTLIVAGSIALFFLGAMLFASGALAQDSIGEPGRSSGNTSRTNRI